MKFKLKSINNIKTTHYNGDVNDLSVLDDNSYVINNVAVHNCGCLTSQQLGIHYPMASLIHECRQLKTNHHLTSKIVADGGIKKYADIIKALALGADHVMIGGLFNKCLESAGQTYVKVPEGWYVKIDDYYSTPPFSRANPSKMIKQIPDLLKDGILYKDFRGMSTKEVQKQLGKKELRTSEGIVTKNKVEYTLDSWADNFVDYLRSAMSYTNSFNLSEFIGNVTLQQISTNALNRFSK